MIDNTVQRLRGAPTKAGGAADDAYAAILAMILDRRLGPAEALAERPLAGALGVSRTPLREALRRLEGEGLLTRRADGSLTVPHLDLETTLDVLAVRRLLEPDAAASAVGRIEPAVIAALRDRVEALATVGDPQGEGRRALDTALHDAIGHACGNRVLAATVAELRRRTLLFATRRVPERLAAVCAEHLAILDALQQGNRDAVRAAMTAHIDATRAGLLRRLTEPDRP